MIYSTESTLKEHRSKISEEEAKQIETAIEDTKKAVQQGDAAEINRAIENLTQASHKLAEAMYKSAGAPSDATASADGANGTGGEEKKEDVVDAEFVDVDDKPKSS